MSNIFPFPSSVSLLCCAPSHRLHSNFICSAQVSERVDEYELHVSKSIAPMKVSRSLSLAARRSRFVFAPFRARVFTLNAWRDAKAVFITFPFRNEMSTRCCGDDFDSYGKLALPRQVLIATTISLQPMHKFFAFIRFKPVHKVQ